MCWFVRFALFLFPERDRHIYVSIFFFFFLSFKLSNTHRQKVERPDVIPLGLHEFAQDAHAQAELLLQVLAALGSVLAPALLGHRA